MHTQSQNQHSHSIVKNITSIKLRVWDTVVKVEMKRKNQKGVCEEETVGVK